jgi:hypothetical protein
MIRKRYVPSPSRWLAFWVTACLLAALLGVSPPQRALSEQLAPTPRALRGFCWSMPQSACSELIGFLWVDLTNHPSARQSAERSRQMPPGCAAVFLWHGADELYQRSSDLLRDAEGRPTNIPSPWPAHGIAETRRAVLEFFKDYKAAGGRMDYLALDYENYPHIDSFERPEWLQALRDDPDARKLLARVAQLPPGVAPVGRIDAPADDPSTDQPKFANLTEMLDNFIWAAINRAIFDPARQVFPDVQMSNFGSFSVTPENPVLDHNGFRIGGLPMTGNRCAPPLYGDFGHLSEVRLSDPRLMNRPLADDRPYGGEPIDVLRYSVNVVRAIGRSCKRPIDPWIAKSNYRAAFFDNPFYEELLYHLGDLLPNACVATFNRLVGGERRGAPVLEAIPWNSELVVSGQEIGDRMLWRITTTKPALNVRVEPSGEVLDMRGAVGRWHVSDRDPNLHFVIAR